MKVAVLGAGMVGRAIARDLSREFEVTSIDRELASLQALANMERSITTLQADLEKANYHQLLDAYDLVVTAVPGFMGFETLRKVIETGTDVVDISFFPEDALQLDQLAKEKNVTAIVDCGVAPGMSNLVLGHYAAQMNVERFECYVGGLPVDPQPPFFYKAPFSPVDVIQEYIRPARLVEDGMVVTRAALSDRELLEFERVGVLEAFNTDGLRSLVHTMSHIAEMKEKTLRYPGHIDIILSMQQAGFFNEQPVDVDGVPVSPLSLTSKLLVDQWKLLPGEAELTVMLIRIIGEKNGKQLTVQYDLLDYYDPVTETSSMARTTGYTCTAAVNLVAKKLFNKHGVFPPELIGDDESCFRFVLDYLAARGVNWKSREFERA